MKKMIRNATGVSLMAIAVVGYGIIRSQIQHYDKAHDQRIESPPETRMERISTNAVLQNPKLISHFRDPNGI